jgi:hypothetical protein
LEAEDLVGILDRLLDGGELAGTAEAPIRAFLDSDWVYDRLLAIARDVASNVRDGRASALDLAKTTTLFERKDGALAKVLFLQTSQVEVPFYLASPDPYVIMPMEPMVFNRFRIDSPAPDFAYTGPSGAMKLEALGEVRLDRAQPLVRRDPLEIYSVRGAGEIRRLCYARGDGSSTYQIAFDKETLAFIGTSMIDISASKAITLLEILEETGSDHAGEAALEYTRHDSPIVRWRALSSLNRARHPAVTDTLERFCDDPVPFISTTARKVLERGKVG